MRQIIVLALSSALTFALAPSAAAQAPGWRTLDLGSGRRATRYLPASVRPCDSLPLVLFLHGAGGTPEDYHSHLEAHAEALGVVLLLPQASGPGWSGADGTTISTALDAVDAELNVDGTRTYLAGHSAGGAYAYILAYDGSTGIAGVFSMSAPFFSIGALSDPAYRAPIHMYYGADDPNYTGGSATMLQAQWTRLSVPQETDVQVGYGHSTWPPSAIRAGFDYLLAQRYPGTPPASECSSGADAGLAMDASIALDAASPRADGGTRADGAMPRDAGSVVDGSTRRPALASGCGCRAGAGRDGAEAYHALGRLAAAMLRRRVARATA